MLFIFQFQLNIILLSKLININCEIIFKNNIYNIFKNDILLTKYINKSNLYLLNLQQL